MQSKRPAFESQSDQSLRDHRNLTEPVVRWPGANLFRNPFGELTCEERAELAVVETDSVFEFIGDASDHETQSFRRYRAYQFIGRCGRGKTTRMLKIRQQCHRSSYVYLSENEPCPVIPEGTPLLIDEAQRLPKSVRRRVFESGLPLVLGTHRDLTRPLCQAGYRVHTERIGRTLSPQLLAAILNRRILASRRDQNLAVPMIDSEAASRFIQKFGTDIRAIEASLYDTVQSQVNQHGEMRFID